MKPEANQVEGANSWPVHFEFPVDKLSVQVQQALQNKVSLLHPKNRYIRGLLLQTLCMEAVKIKSHPDHGQKIDMARSIILQWPHLKEQVGRGYDGWLSSILDGLKSAHRSVGLIDTARSDAIMKQRMIASHHGTPGDLSTDDVILVQNMSSSDSELSACSREPRQTPVQITCHWNPTLEQPDGNGIRVIAYASRALSNAETSYCTTRKELLAVIYGLKQFRQHLLAREFVIRTDYAALTHLRRTPEPIGQQARWWI